MNQSMRSRGNLIVLLSVLFAFSSLAVGANRAVAYSNCGLQPCILPFCSITVSPSQTVSYGQSISVKVSGTGQYTGGTWTTFTIGNLCANYDFGATGIACPTQTGTVTYTGQFHQGVLWGVERALLIGAEYLVVHPGNYKDVGSLEQGMLNVAEALALAWRAVDDTFKTKPRLTVLLESTAGAGAQLGGDFPNSPSFKNWLAVSRHSRRLLP